MPAGSQQRRAQDPRPALRCGTKGKTGNQQRQGGNGDGNRDGSGDGRKCDYGEQHEGKGRSGNRNGNGKENRGKNRDEVGGQRERGNLRRGNRGGSEDAGRWATPTKKKHPQPSQRNHRVMLTTRAQGREARNRIEKDGREVEKRKKLQRSFRRDVGNGGGLGGNRNTRTRKCWFSSCRPRYSREQQGSRGRSTRYSGLSKNCTSRESVSPLSRTIIGFRNKYNKSPLGRTNASNIERLG